MIKFLLSNLCLIKNNKTLSILILLVISFYNSPFLFLEDLSLISFKKIFIIFQHITPVVLFFILLFYASRSQFFKLFLEKKYLLLAILFFINLLQIYGTFFGELEYFYPVNEVSSQIYDRIIVDYKVIYVRLLYIISNFNLFFLIFILNEKKILKLILIILLILIFFVFLNYFIIIMRGAFTVDNSIFFYESESIGLGKKLFTFTHPRSSGLGRMTLILSIFFTIYFLHFKFDIKKKKIITELFFLFSIIVLNFFIFHLQSRFAIYFLFLFTFFLIFFWSKFQLKKIFLIIFLFVFPLFLSTAFSEFKKNMIIDKYCELQLRNNPNFICSKNEINIAMETLLSSESRIIKTSLGLSNREEAWLKIIKSYKDIPILGFGVLADKFIYQVSASSIFLYLLISGGFVSLALIVYFNIYIFLRMFKFLIKKKLDVSSNSVLFKFSYVCIVCFLARSLIENSYGQFSIDLMIFAPCCLIFENYLRKFKIIS
jgi:hypothetical protein